MSLTARPVLAISPHDPNSFGNNRQVKVAHSHLNLTVDFSTSTLSGYVDHSCEVVSDSASELLLDTSSLTISYVCLASDPAQPRLPFRFGATDDTFGTPLQINLLKTAKKGDKFTVRIFYTTSPSATAIQWLSPAQTKGGVYPYLFTQCQAIHCRSLVPIQDSPSNKFTYTASITVDAPLVALMSATQLSSTPVGDKLLEYKFEQVTPIPSYLLAMAVGALEKRKIGPRSHVWSEKETVDAGAHEFADTEAFIAAGEKICGPYVWGTYDILLLPPSFPYGGMENPQLTFVTPTLLAGDRSLANVVAHEIAHSWFGNEVTSETWESFWMNEGFTVLLERKIMKAMFDEQHQHLHACIGFKDLQNSVDRFGHDHQHTCLCPRLKGIDPDDAFSSVPYEKGFNFLTYLENLCGGESVMNPFLRAHCERYHHSTVNSTEWKGFFIDYMTNVAKVPKEKLDTIDWDAWYNKPGMPIVQNEFDQTLLLSAEKLARDLIEVGVDPQPDDLKSYASAQIVIFLEKLISYQKEKKLSVEAFTQRLLAMDKAYLLASSRNSEVRFRWLTLWIRQGSDVLAANNIYPLIEQFLSEQGRMKFIRPLYRDMFEVGGAAGEKAQQIFKQHGSMYHSIAHKMVAKDLQLA